MVHEGKVLLHWHRKLQRWLPPGGHIEPGELPDEAAVRETLEETGLQVALVDAPNGAPVFSGVEEAGSPRRLTQPMGLQLEDIAPGHQHVDLIYLAGLARPAPALGLADGAGRIPRAPPDDPHARPGWHSPEAWRALGVSAEIDRWAMAAVEAIASLHALDAPDVLPARPDAAL